MRTAVKVAAIFLSSALCVGAEDLLRELQRRNQTEGLALIRLRNNFAEVVTFDDIPSDLNSNNPRGISNAWFSSDGRFVAWEIYLLPKNRFEGCPSPTIVESVDGTYSWQLPGSILNPNALGVSTNRHRLAFDATYKPPGTGVLNIPENRGRWITGLFHADSKKHVTPISKSCGTTSISWSPDGSSFVYDCDGHILIFDVATGQSRTIAPGSSPSWSPDGRWIAFRNADGRAATIDPITQKIKPFMDGRRIVSGIQWSLTPGT